MRTQVPLSLLRADPREQDLGGGRDLKEKKSYCRSEAVMPDATGKRRLGVGSQGG